MSEKGDCLDNAVVERFFSIFKTEAEADDWKRMTARDVKSEIVDFIEIFYNSQRLHSNNGYRSPNDYERLTVGLNGVSVFP